MKTVKQIYKDYLENQEKELEKARKQIEALELDIKKVKEFLEANISEDAK